MSDLIRSLGGDWNRNPRIRVKTQTSIPILNSRNKALARTSLKNGRSVARSRPGASNTNFDTKVLSRNDGLMYEAGQKVIGFLILKQVKNDFSLHYKCPKFEMT